MWFIDFKNFSPNIQAVFCLFKLVNLSNLFPRKAICAGPRRLSGLRFLNVDVVFFQIMTWMGFRDIKILQKAWNIYVESDLQDGFFQQRTKHPKVFVFCGVFRI